MPSPAAINPRSVAISLPSNAIFGKNDASAHTLLKMMRRVCSGLRARNGSDDNSVMLRVRLAANRCVCATAINNFSSRRWLQRTSLCSNIPGTDKHRSILPAKSSFISISPER